MTRKQYLYENSIFFKDLSESSYITPDVLITPEQISALQEYCSYLEESFYFNDILSESLAGSVKEKFSEVLERDLKKLFNNNEKNYQEAKQLIKTTTTSITSEIKTNGLKKDSTKSISHKLETLFKKLEKLLFDSIDEQKIGKYDVARLVKALITMGVAITINTIGFYLLTAILGPAIGNIITVCAVAPLVEELCKKLSISGNFEAEFAIIFNSYEMIYYVSKMKKLGIPLLKAIKARTFVVLMHLSTTVVQWLSKNEKVQKALHLNDEQSKTIGYFIAVLIHATWNVLGTFSSSFTKFLIK